MTLNTNTMRDESMLVSIGAGLAVVGLFSLPSLVSFVRQVLRRDPRQDVYADGDGTSTPEAVKAFSARPAKSAILLFAFAGCAASLAISVLVTLRLTRDESSLEDWLSSATWVRPPLCGLWSTPLVVAD